MKMTSSAMPSRENAASSRLEPVSRWLHRARTTGPRAGIVPRLRPPVTNSVHTGAWVRAQKANAAVVTVNTVTSGQSTRACPQRSVSRAARGVTTTYISAPTVDTAPATAYEPVTVITSMTWARLSMPIGSRPTIPGIANGSAPGTRRASR